MSTHKRIYSPDNEPFDVPEPRRSELLLNQGWSQAPQEAAPPPEVAAVTETPRGRRGRSEPEVETPVEVEQDPVFDAVEDEDEAF